MNNMIPGKITLITPPDKLFNFDIGYLLVNPSLRLKMQFQQILSHVVDENINVFIYESDDVNIEWLLTVSQQSDFIIVDIDNCNEMTKNFVSFLLCMPNSFYLTSNETIPWGLINKNRIYNLDWILDSLGNPGDKEERKDDDE